MNIKNIVFSAGSMGGLTFVGAWRAIEEHGLISSIENISGCSIGSVMALLVSIGYTSEELELLALNFRYKDIADFQVLNTFENLGMETGNEIERLLRELLFYKTGHYDMSFAIHKTITGRNLWVNASCVQQDCPYYFSQTRTPDMNIIKAVRMSISLPVIMTPVKHHELTFIDGGFHDPCPVGMFYPDDTLVLRIKNDHSFNGDDEFTGYIGMLFHSIYSRLHVNINRGLEQYNVLYLDSGIGSLTLNIRKSIRRKLIRIGYNKLQQYLNTTTLNK